MRGYPTIFKWAGAILVAGGAALSAAAAPVPALRAPGGVSDYGTVASSPTVRLDGTMTLEAWVHPTAWRSYTGREKHGLNIMYKGRIGSYIDYVLALQEDGILCLGNTWGYIGVLNRRVPLNQWTHVAVSVNESAGSFVFYINGVNCGGGSGWQGASLSRTAFLGPSDHPLYVGGFNQMGWGYNNDNFIGYLADVRMWNIVRTPAEIAENYQKQLRGTEPGLGAYWTFVDRLDKSPNKNNMTLKGGAALLAGQGPDLQGAGGIEVALTTPTNNQIVARGTDLGLAATATSTAGVSRVDFHANGTLKGSATEAPYAATWTNVPAGIHTISARATNAAGQAGTSADVKIRVHGPFGGAPAAAPGRVEAEQFDLGGQDLAYHDVSAANEGGKYRTTEAVDISADAGASNGFVVGWTTAPEWMSYVLNVASSGTYAIRTRVAAVGTGGQFRILINGQEAGGALAVPNTGAWNAYQWVALDGVALAQGVCTMRVAMVANGASGAVGAFDTFMIVESRPVVQEAYPAGVPWAAPGVVQAEDFDLGGPNLGYRDFSAANEGGQYRATEAVDISADAGASNGFVVGWTKADEWMSYILNVASSGTYAVRTRVAAVGAGGQFRILINGQEAGGALAVPNTGAWTAYQWVTCDGVALPQGVCTMRVAMVANGASGNVGAFDCFVVEPPLASGQQPFNPTFAPWPAVAGVEFEDFDHGGGGVAYQDASAANEGGLYRVGEGVDITAQTQASNGFAVGWTPAGEWLEYTVSTPSNGTYDLEVRVANGGTGATCRLLVDGRDATGPVAIPNTGSWTAYQTVRRSGLQLREGVSVFRFELLGVSSAANVGSFDRWRLVPAGPLFAISEMSAPPGTGPVLRWGPLTNRFRIHHATSLAEPDWAPVTDWQTGSEYELPLGDLGTTGFYRVESAP